MRKIKDLVGSASYGSRHPCSCCIAGSICGGETRLDAEGEELVCLALQKCSELALLRDALNSGDTAAITEWSALIQASSPFDPRAQRGGGKRLAAITAPGDSQRASPHEVRARRHEAPAL
ncbi:hypothetical protein LNP74_14090 [Klebsiella pneumoniae subsp. pneumoniae]|nr:hypothetical protein [Klebsiella pneumoniae subsp. pneumoniae]